MTTYKEKYHWLKARDLRTGQSLGSEDLREKSDELQYDMCMKENITERSYSKLARKYLSMLKPRADHPMAFRCGDGSIIVAYHNYDDQFALEPEFEEGPDTYYPGWAKSYYRKFEGFKEIRKAIKDLG